MYIKREKYQLPPKASVKSVKDLADQIGVSPKTIWRAYAEGRQFVMKPASINWMPEVILRQFLSFYLKNRSKYIRYVQSFVKNYVTSEQIVDDAYIYVCQYATSSKNLPLFFKKIIFSMTKDKMKTYENQN